MRLAFFAALPYFPFMHELGPRPGLRERLSRAFSKAQGLPIEYELGSYLRRVGILAALPVEGLDLATSYAELRARSAATAEGRGDPSPSEREILVLEVLSLAVEASRRTLGLEPFEGQLVAALALVDGRAVQMQTGEGKTLAAALAAPALALEGRVHVLTANDYLAARDAAWMGPLHRALGLRSASIGQATGEAERRAAYEADITYLTARECGFDLLRDGLRRRAADFVQLPFHAALVDEADFVLIDEGRIPLVIAGASDLDPAEALEADRLASGLVPGRDFSIDREGRRAPLGAEGRERVEARLAAGWAEVSGLVHNYDDLPGEGARSPEAEFEEGLERGVARVHAALVARHLLRLDVDYIVRGGRIELVDGFTGRVADRRRWPWGVQAALEAKETLEPTVEGRIYGSIAVQHLLALYPRLGAMTATAVPAAEELAEAYGLGVVVVPPERPSRRVDADDRLFATAAAKDRALLAEITGAAATGRPVLVGTASVRESERLAAALAGAGLAPRVLNARNDAEEAEVIAEAGALGALTISTNMAGRGTDIRLGGSRGGAADRARVEALGGLYVIGTNRHESRRIDQQLRGRAGRQGEPGLSRFFVSLEDPLFVAHGVRDFLPADLQAGDGEAIEDPRVHREIRRAQSLIEAQNHRLRTRLRRRSLVLEYERRRVRELRDEALRDLSPPPEVTEALGPGLPAPLALRAFLAALDRFWAGHLEFAEEVAEGIGLVALGGRDPDREYLERVAGRYEEGIAGLGAATAALVAEAARVHGGLPDAAAFDRAGIDTPSSTWTYQVDEDPLPGFSLGLSASGNLAAAMAAPLHLLTLLIDRLARRRRG